MLMVRVGVPGCRASSGMCIFMPYPSHSYVRGVPGTTSNEVLATMSAPRMGTERESAKVE